MDVTTTWGSELWVPSSLLIFLSLFSFFSLSPSSPLQHLLFHPSLAFYFLFWVPFLTAPKQMWKTFHRYFSLESKNIEAASPLQHSAEMHRIFPHTATQPKAPEDKYIVNHYSLIQNLTSCLVEAGEWKWPWIDEHSSRSVVWVISNFTFLKRCTFDYTLYNARMSVAGLSLYWLRVKRGCILSKRQL